MLLSWPPASRTRSDVKAAGLNPTLATAVAGNHRRFREREAFRVARPGASADEVHRAARAARLDEVVDRLPLGWANPVGEGGRLLSGGERHRVSLARAF